MSTLGVETHTLTIRERVLNAITKALVVGFHLIKTAVVTIAFNLIITAITNYNSNYKKCQWSNRAS